MNERERLIELLEEENAFSRYITADERREMLADHLLANGVIVPPVELGSRHKIYIPVGGTTVVYETKVYGIGIDEDGDTVINPKEYPEEVITINGYNLGKTVFLSREEAEKALKERSEGE